MTWNSNRRPRAGGTALLVAMLWAATSPRIAQADDARSDWTQSFATPVVDEHVKAGGGNVVVVAAGPSSEQLDDVVRALTAALRGAASVDYAVGADGLGDVSRLDDRSIVERATPLPVGRIVIVRMNPGEHRPAAIVTIFDEQGDAVGGFLATPGVPVAGPSDVLVHVDHKDGGSDDEMAEVFLDEEQLDLEWEAALPVPKDFRARTGDGRVLTGGEFYRYVGRDDLATSYTRRRRRNKGLKIGGWIGVAVGLPLLVVTPAVALTRPPNCASAAPSPEFVEVIENCVEDWDKTMRITAIGGGTAGFALTAAGTGMLIAGYVDNPHTMTQSEAVETARTHNEKVRRTQGTRDLPRSSGLARVLVSPAAGPSGGGVTVVGRF